MNFPIDCRFRFRGPLAAVLRTAGAASLLLALTGWSAQDDADSLANALLERAQDKAAKASYDQALSLYRKLASKYPQTDAGRTAILRTKPNALLGWSDIVRSGPSENRVDVIFMGDGYTLGHLKSSFQSRSADLVDGFEREPALAEYFDYFNFTRAAVLSAEDGVDGYGREYDTALDGYSDTSRGNDYAVIKPARVLEFLDQLPAHDGFAVAIVKDRSLGSPTGPVATVGGAKRDLDAVVHAWGHAFAGLGDEFADPDGHHSPPGNRPNVSATEDNPSWQHWIDAKAPGIGTYEGASGRVRDIWRPTASNCVMNSAKRFCPVCRETVILNIYKFVDGIDSATPTPHEFGSEEELEATYKSGTQSRYEKLDFEVVTMRPKSHALEASWWIVPEHRAPRSKGIRVSSEERVKRGPLPPIEIDPVHTQRTSKSGRYSFEINPGDLDPGRYRVIFRAIDTTKVRGERKPWVLKDPAGLLQFERGWWIKIPPP